jgi:spoIIIJ-associated protein
MDSNYSVETTADTVDEAISSALQQLNAQPHEVLVEVLEESSRGLLGIGAKPARVRVKLLRPPEPVKPIVSEGVARDTSAYDDEDDEDDEFGEGAEFDNQNDGQVGKEVLETLLSHMDMDASVTVRQGEPNRPGDAAPWILDVKGTNISKLIGRRGETLNALQYLTRLITSRHLQRRANIIVDADSYKERRFDKLRSLATRMADQAVQQGRTVTLEPMPPNERRIIHLELRDREDVLTESTGEGDSRKVSIVPK